MKFFLVSLFFLSQVNDELWTWHDRHIFQADRKEFDPEIKGGISRI
jgi:hypothetical protein